VPGRRCGPTAPTMGGITCSRPFPFGEDLLAMQAASGGTRRFPVPVTLHVYDIGCGDGDRTLNCILGTILGAGAFHCGVEVHGCEWSYGEVMGARPDDDPPVSGVSECKPQQAYRHTYGRSVEMGSTHASPREVLSLLRLLMGEWPAHHYNIVSRNCCHFCDEFCHRLLVGGIPAWVNKLASKGQGVETSLFEVSDLLCCEAMLAEGPDSLCKAPSVRACRLARYDAAAEEDEARTTIEETEIQYLL